MGALKKRKVLVLIPARFQSTRFPGKPLAMIQGKEMIRYVYENCEVNSQEIEAHVCVVTDHPEIEACVKSFSGNVVRIDDDVPSGSERIYLAFKRFFKEENFELVVNVQGDEPLLKGKDIEALSLFHLNSDFNITTFVHPSHDFEGFQNPNQVKVVWSKSSGRCLYFSRASIPYDRDKSNDELEWFHHIGVYSYRPESLESFCQKPLGYYENREKLEQLRALEAGMSIGALAIERKLYGVDKPEDIKKVEGLLNER